MKQLQYIYQNNNAILNDAFDRLVAQLYIKKQKDNVKSVVICGTEPGVGTTTIAINLAISMSNSGWKTLLVDCDLRKADKNKRLSEESAKGLVDYFDGSSSVNEITIPTNYDSLKYIAGGAADVNSVSPFCSSKMKALVDELNENYDYIIFDMPSMTTALDASVVGCVVDGVIMVTSQQKGYTKKAIVDAKKQLDSAGANILGIIVNKVEHAEYRRAMKNYDYFRKQKYRTGKSVATKKAEKSINQ